MRYVCVGLLYVLQVFAAPSNVELIGGTPADPQEWPASVVASIDGWRCSATVVGPQTLLIAAHCAGNGDTATFQVNGVSEKAVCTRAPEYSGNSTADWALCLSPQEIRGIEYEQLNIDPAAHAMGDKLMLTGYGCIQQGGGGGNDGIFRIGEAAIIRVPSGTNNDIVTEGNAALCFGDSGGSAFLIDAETKSRYVVGVNSRGDISTTSYLSSVSTPMAKKFIDNWSMKNHQRICGYHADAVGCRK